MTVQVESVQSRCRETAGFLFSHPCRNAATARCTACGKPICEAHSRPREGQPVCVGCERRAVPPEERAARRDDPYFYAWACFDDYDSDGAFTEADRAAFADVAGGAEAGDAGWENDWDAS